VVIRPAEHEARQIVQLNPPILGQSEETDEQFEGCLSFFDVRGLVRRSVRLTVESARLDGSRHACVFEGALARLVAHELDHLDGRLYLHRMDLDAPLVLNTE
jgi:peptide deformylase